MEHKGPLKGLKVLEMANVIAGPFCASLMADYGADVIKIEMPEVGDPFRQLLPKHKGQSVRWATMGRNKRCVTLDLKSPQGRDLFLKLLKDADCGIENFRPGTIEKWGLGYDIMKQVNPKVVLVRISGYGQTGPYHNKVGFGTPATAYAGYTALQGYPDRAPVSPPVSLSDFMAGMYGFMGALSAIYALQSGSTSKGQVVDVSLYEPLVRMEDEVISEYGINGRIKPRMPIAKGSSSPSGTFQTLDHKWVILVASTQKTWSRIPAAMGRPELLDDPRFRTNQDRVDHDQELLAIIEAWAATLKMRELVAILDEAGVPACPVNEVDDMFTDPQYTARESIVTVPHPDFGQVSMTNIFPLFSGTPCEIRHCGVPLGADNQSVYQSDLGLSQEEYSALMAAGVI